jgi:lipopolysaccharide/colanic/teichoic acid biosynthesis glycosyltransferase
VSASGSAAMQMYISALLFLITSNPFHFGPCMATQATELTDSDVGYVGPNPPKTTPPRASRLRDRLTFRTNVIPLYHALFEPAAYGGPSTSVSTDRATRALNIFIAAVGLVLAMPLFLLIAVAIKLSSRGPVFYKQTRIGLDRRWNSAPSHEDSRMEDLGGRPFTMYKFRTMVVSAESAKKEVWATPFDGRVTKLGRRLRNTRLDELPQLLNVLAGDMNIVGPRPEQPTIFAELREVIPNYHMRQRVMPGITGWAQVNLAYDTSVDDVRRKVEYDLEYLSTRSAARDLRIMVRTVPIVLSSRLGW